jgi:hypothetical protein
VRLFCYPSRISLNFLLHLFLPGLFNLLVFLFLSLLVRSVVRISETHF